MCIKCEIKKAMLKEAGLEEVVTVLGTMGRGYIKELTQLDVAEDKLKAQIDADLERRIEEEKAKVFAKVKAEIEAKYAKKFDDLMALQKKVFEEGVAAAGITEDFTDKDYAVNKLSGEVELREVRPLAAANE